MRTEMDVLLLGNYLLLKQEQPPWPEKKGHVDEYMVKSASVEPALLTALTETYEKAFLPLVHQIKANGYSPLIRPFKKRATTWEDYTGPSTPKAIFPYPDELLAADGNPSHLEETITQYWSDQDLAKFLKPVIAQLMKIGRRFSDDSELVEEISDSIYVMF
jgi:carbamoyltransferase